MSQEVDNNEVAVEPKAQEFDAKELLERMEKMEASNARLLEESKSWKSKYQDMRTQQDEAQKIKLTENEQWKELVEIEKNQNHELKEKLKHKTKVALQRDLNFKVASIAGDAYDVNDIINSLPKNLLNLDEENETVEGIEEAVNFVRENKPHLFKRENKSGMTSERPLGEVPKDKTFDEKVMENPKGMLNEVLADLIK